MFVLFLFFLIQACFVIVWVHQNSKIPKWKRKFGIKPRENWILQFCFGTNSWSFYFLEHIFTTKLYLFLSFFLLFFLEHSFLFTILLFFLLFIFSLPARSMSHFNFEHNHFFCFSSFCLPFFLTKNLFIFYWNTLVSWLLLLLLLFPPFFGSVFFPSFFGSLFVLPPFLLCWLSFSCLSVIELFTGRV